MREPRWPWVRPSAIRSTLVLWAKSLLNAVLFFGIFMLLLPWGAHALLPAALPLPRGPRTGAAILLALAGFAIWLHCLDVFSRRGRGTPLPMDTPRHLVASGLFAIVRNPIMAGELMVIWAEAIYFASLGILIYAVVISIAAHVMVVYIEEPELRERFGESYEEYSRRVPRWIPRWTRNQGPG